MVQLRILIELNNQSKTYPITFHYCNWLLHPSLNRRLAPEMVKRINKALDESANVNAFLKEISEILSVKRLINEIQDLIVVTAKNKKAFLFGEQIISDEYWLNFLKILLNELIHRPLILNSKEPLQNNFGFDIYGLQLVSAKEKIVVELMSNELEKRNKQIFVDLVIMK